MSRNDPLAYALDCLEEAIGELSAVTRPDEDAPEFFDKYAEAEDREDAIVAHAFACSARATLDGLIQRRRRERERYEREMARAAELGEPPF